MSDIREKKRGRPEGAKNKQGCKYPWRSNVVRYSCDVIPAVLDILWRRGSLRLTEILKCIAIEPPRKLRWYDGVVLRWHDGVTLEPSALIKIISEAVEQGSLITEYGGTLGSTDITRYVAATERTGWYWRGNLISGYALAKVCGIAPKNIRARLEAGWDVEAARSVEGGKGAIKKKRSKSD